MNYNDDIPQVQREASSKHTGKLHILNQLLQPQVMYLYRVPTQLTFLIGSINNETHLRLCHHFVQLTMQTQSAQWISK